MLQTIALAGLFVEILILCMLGFVLRKQGFTLLVTLGLCGCFAVTWRVVVCLISAIVAGAMRRAAGKALPFGNSLRAFRVETRAKMLSMSFLQPFHPLFMGAEPENGDTKVAPIVLLHGYVSNRGIWWWFRKQLQRALPQSVIYSLTIEPVFGSIDSCALHLAERLAAIQLQHPNQPITVIVHSMGGLMIRAYLRDCAIAGKAHGLAKLICLGSPHAGTQFARFGFGVCAQEMRWKSPWILALQEFELGTPVTLPVTCIYTLNDDLVYPAESGALIANAETSHIEHVAVSAVGHVSLLFSPDVLALVLKRL
jgi:triacylglycerol lipase